MACNLSTEYEILRSHLGYLSCQVFKSNMEGIGRQKIDVCRVVIGIIDFKAKEV